MGPAFERTSSTISEGIHERAASMPLDAPFERATSRLTETSLGSAMQPTRPSSAMSVTVFELSQGNSPVSKRIQNRWVRSRIGQTYAYRYNLRRHKQKAKPLSDLEIKRDLKQCYGRGRSRTLMPGELSVCSNLMQKLLENSGKDPEVFKVSAYSIVLRVITESRLDYLSDYIEVTR
jgi:hypothetical protein